MIRLLHKGCFLWRLKSDNVIYGPPLIVAIIVIVAIAATIIISKPAEKSSVRQEIEASAREPEIQKNCREYFSSQERQNCHKPKQAQNVNCCEMITSASPPILQTILFQKFGQNTFFCPAGILSNFQTCKHKKNGGQSVPLVVADRRLSEVETIQRGRQQYKG